jgi:hypothetical protein
MADHLICHAIGGPGSFSAGRIFKLLELAFSAISDHWLASFASSYQDLGEATGELRAPTFGNAA